MGDGQGIHWPIVDEDISVAGLLAGTETGINRLPAGQGAEESLQIADKQFFHSGGWGWVPGFGTCAWRHCRVPAFASGDTVLESLVP